MSGLRVAFTCLRSAVVALCVAPLLGAGATPDRVKIALDAYEPNVSEQNEETLKVRVAEIEAVLDLNEERATALHALKEKAMEAGLAAWRRRAEKALAEPSVTDQQLQQGFAVDPEPEDAPEKQAAWQDGLATVLSPAELKRLAERRVERKERRTRNLADLFLLFVDEKLALSAQQRARLLPIARNLVPKIQEMIPEEVEQDDDLFNPVMLLSAGKEAPEKAVRAILVDAQWTRWQKVCVPPSNGNVQIPGLVDPLAPPPASAADQAAAAPPAREPVNQTLSKYMSAQSILQRQRLLEPLLLQIEEAARVADLSPELCARLKIGARGSAEKSLQKWAPQFQQFVRNNVQDTTPEKLSQRLAQLGNPVVFQSPVTGPAKDGIFEKCVKSELTPEQMAAWQKEIADRREFRSQTIIRTMLTTFDRIVPLQSDQFTKLAAMVTVLFAEYREEMEAGHSSEQIPWYLQSDLRAAPLAGLQPGEMEALLGKTRWERWTKTEEYSDAKSCWNNIKEMRQNRRP